MQGRISEKMPADVGTAGLCAAMFGFFFAEGGPLTSFEDVVERADSKKFAQWHRGMLEHGVYLAPSMYEVPSCPGRLCLREWAPNAGQCVITSAIWTTYRHEPCTLARILLVAC